MFDSLVGVLCEFTHSAVKSESDEHEEEDDGPEGGPRHVGYCLRVHFEHQTGPWNNSLHSSQNEINIGAKLVFKKQFLVSRREERPTPLL